MKAVAVLLCLALAGPVTAQDDVPFDIAPTADCVDAAAPRQGDMCIGKAASACLDRSEVQNTAASVNCTFAEYEWWQAALATTRDRLARALAESDAENASLGKDRATLLRKEAQAFKDWRKATCDVARADARGGTLGGVLDADCRLQMTADYVLDLSARLIALRGQ